MGGVIALPKLFKQAQAAEAAKLSPTVAEVSQSEATSADGYDLRKTKAKGRSATIITGSKGVEDETITLGKKSLLGQ
jgi:hypothetical protein